MPMKYSEDLPQDDKQHFTKCSCGHYFDMRDLADVIRLMQEKALIQVDPTALAVNKRLTTFPAMREWDLR